MIQILTYPPHLECIHIRVRLINLMNFYYFKKLIFQKRFECLAKSLGEVDLFTSPLFIFSQIFSRLHELVLALVNTPL